MNTAQSTLVSPVLVRQTKTSRESDCMPYTRAESARVITLLDPRTRGSVAAALQDKCTMIHVDSAKEAMAVTNGVRVRVLLISPTATKSGPLMHVSHLVRRSVGLMTIALMSEHSTATDRGLLDLGGIGVREVVDLSVRGGWDALRDLLDHAGDDVAPRIMDALEVPLANCGFAAQQLFEFLARCAPVTPSAKLFACKLGILPTSLMSHFSRAGLPSPKQLLAETRLLYAIAILRIPQPQLRA